MSSLVIAQAMLIGAVAFSLLAVIATIRYRITGEALEVLVLGLVARRVLLTDIEEVHRRGAFVRESWCGLKFWNSVTIRRRSGLLRNFVISPDDPEAFAERLRESARH
ncbi:MAG: hypothetical protein HY510_04770 [Acidobacteria bacterium]|nr:hypothetical protein [Acidobacteriota bacterium]